MTPQPSQDDSASIFSPMSSKVGIARLTGATEMNIFAKRLMEKVRMAGFKLCFLYEQMVVS